jgi:hypothetical protein
VPEQAVRWVGVAGSGTSSGSKAVVERAPSSARAAASLALLGQIHPHAAGGTGRIGRRFVEVNVSRAVHTWNGRPSRHLTNTCSTIRADRGAPAIAHRRPVHNLFVEPALRLVSHRSLTVGMRPLGEIGPIPAPPAGHPAARSSRPPLSGISTASSAATTTITI